MSKLPIDQFLKEAFKRNRSGQTHKEVHARAVELIRRCWAENIFIVFTDGLRTNVDQAVLYGKGRKSYIYNGKQYGNPTAKVVTKAMPGESMHNYGLALDFVTCDGEGKNIDWVVGPKWKRAAAISKELGFAWGGDWKGFVDNPHIEYNGGLALSAIQKGTFPKFKSFTPINLNPKPTEPPKKEESKVEYKKDEKPSEWAEKAVAWAQKNGISTGEYLKQPATREEVLTIVYNAFAKLK